MVFKGRHSRKSLLTRGRASATTTTARPDFSPLHQTHARYEKKKRRGTPRNAKAWKKLDRPRLSVRVRRFAGPLAVSAAAPVFFLFPQSRDLLSLFFPSGRRYFSRLTTVRLHRGAMDRPRGNTRVRGGVTSVENRRAMKRMSRPTLCRY